jgi:hypothetical protein
MIDLDSLVDFATKIFPNRNWRSPIDRLIACARARKGEALDAVARELKVSKKSVDQLVRSKDPVSEALDVRASNLGEDYAKKAKKTLGQMLLGRAAEVVFEKIYRAAMHSQEFELVDLRESRSDTDYRVLNGSKRPVYRINIKFHGASFRQAEDWVGLKPENCFPLATYKIYSALKKQEEEHLPYVFVIVGIRNLIAEDIGEQLPSNYIAHLAVLMASKRVTGKRGIEDAIVDRIATEGHKTLFETMERLEKADWFVLSARRADRLLREKLYDRVFALRVRGFAQHFRRAELDMHFSLSEDLTPLDRFLNTLKIEGQTKVASMLERGAL